LVVISSAMDQTLDNPLVLVGQLTGYGFSMALSVMLAFLVWRSPGAGRAGRSVFALCAGLWSLGGLLHCALHAAGFPPLSAPTLWLEALALGAAALWPLGLFLLWDASDGLTPAQRQASSVLMRIASVNAILLVAILIAHISSPRTDTSSSVAWHAGDEIRMAVAYNALALVVSGLLWIRRLPQSVPERLGVALILLGPLLSVGTHLISRAGLLPAGGAVLAAVLVKQSAALTILGGLFFLGRFRAADSFARLSLRVLLSAGLGIVLVCIIQGPLVERASLSAVADAVFFVSGCAAIASSLFIFEFLGRHTDRWVARQIFGRADPVLVLRQLRDELSRQETPGAALSVAEGLIAAHLRLDVRLLPNDSELSAPDRRNDCFLVRVGEDAPYILAPVGPQAKLSLLGGELDVLHQAAELVGRRLEALERERERLDRSRREASLAQQLLEAELRALRAQINPHFLFNSLNTIAALVHHDPTVAEAMTIRLARIFRHVLVQTERPFSSLREEMQFLQAYLEIEQIRFGERLKVEFQVSESIRLSAVPSLILQPLVENAIKHGLAPKLGECRLLIGGRTEGGQMVLRVQDNGVGVRAAGPDSSTGHGLRNIRDRLTALYGERARLSFESQPHSGSCATVYLPLTGI
jgi:two-component system LytT family sensor kinase